MAEDLSSFIQSHLYGVPQLRPDEKRAFLGNFRERVAMAVTIRQLADPKMTDLLAKILKQYPGYRVYLNGRMPQKRIIQYMQQAQSFNYPFTVMAQDGMRVQKAVSPTDFGWVLAHPTEKIARPILI
ncbi:DUF1694 domain-containing protein [Lacticaseibacillus saniviri]|uniref:DUF1694 domain-containing protein n=1 Tax=Lacticaseibacillus saniviri JCM 17471 = DSM 24301 TaxID=1293598 RepID=A0A0R2MY26_9LACO|nr:DUF1694 domain-containing protein [Lacticaseibacillus saniviri]KRO18455.1 hypothetical protein IV56_GL001589 [Lacticaseibacillus saniviri JCM 17471 = DSM 24301]